MKPRARSAPFACCAMLSMALTATTASAASPNAASPNAAGADDAQSGLNAEQLRAVGIQVAHPIAAKAPERIEALGRVLDATVLISDMGESTVAAAAEQAASAELERLRALHAGGAAASLKMIEAAQSEQARARAQAQLAAARFTLHWGPLAALPPAERQRVVDASTSGRSLLVRADLPGRHSFGTGLRKAVLDVDGIQVPGRVLGLLRETSELQSTGLLIEVPSAPSGLGVGARLQLALLTGDRKGLLLPRESLLFDETGAYVYKQLTKKTDAEKARYAVVRVNLLLPYGDGWLVEGVDDDDNIVVRGAGVLWSLQGVGSQQHEDDDED
ncbi:MAG TPA: hypothetical protein VNV61_13145 [Steroidobacteraceae bacterium]|nr:hypothetical protein [Steroidobacteraceae bacterium]